MNHQPRVVVVGGGYAGVMAANRLAPHADVTLVNPRRQFVERIRLHQLAAGNDDAVADFGTVLHPAVTLVVDTATAIDAPNRRVELASGDAVAYDYLLYAIGSTGAVAQSLPGGEFVYPISELEQAQRLRARLDDVADTAPMVVVGGGLTGIEAAAEFAGAGREVTLVATAVGPSLSAPGRRSVVRQLRKLGVRMIEQTVASVSDDHVTLADGRRLPSAVTVWTAGFGVPGLAAASGLTTDALGRLVTDETLTSVDDDHIVAAGDAAAPSALPYRMSCQASLPLGAHAAETVLARIAGTRPAEASVPMSAQCISVGRRGGTLQIQRKDDTPLPLYIGGRAGALIKEQVCRYTLKWLAAEAEQPGTYALRPGPDRAGQVAAAVS
ncbi:FAD-dependent oxidoreductase [Mycolicibacterium duvalii]|uniref:Dehydrogenase n=1 Tax=Mycolicibacterium duvalii TaxID=39688 RepID=A0A7I7K8G4_9MYCO|nr:FAD-dependent oxidoreductase [Mycolicibacterium duvalii]MCV7368378.1 FAD-dependent oxidoreductase [Mycolicibacterium duvalii]PEG41811.1 FAD-dependent oxidoreductase [Mycolicibacterium duvalii]BBX20480.1 dehydrogenase [Mycolicibacterium duvalii]